MPPGESCSDFHRLFQAFAREVEPRGAVEEMYVRDIARIVWETLRLQRTKSVTISTAYCAAVEAIVGRLMTHLGEPPDRRRAQTAELVRQWFGGNKHESLQLLNRFDLDESAFAAEAIRQSSFVLDPIDKTLTALEARRDKALAGIVAYRASFARKMRDTVARIAEAESRELPRPADAGANGSSG